MNAVTEAASLELVEEQTQRVPATQQGGALAVNSPAAMMLQAMSQGASLEQVEKMMDLQERWEKREAEKAFNEALAAFKAEAVEVLKCKQVGYTTKDGEFVGYKHAELSDVVEAVGPALSKHGFSHRWDVKQERGEITVTCILKHSKGHSESVTMSAPPDASGKKNAIQQIASATSYLQRYTLKAITGVAEKGQDDDGNGFNQANMLDAWLSKVNAAKTLDELDAIYQSGTKAFQQAKDTQGYRAFAAAGKKRSSELKEAKNG